MGEYSRPDVAMNGAGDSLVVWHDFYDNFFTSSGRRFASDGSPIGVEPPLSTGGERGRTSCRVGPGRQLPRLTEVGKTPTASASPRATPTSAGSRSPPSSSSTTRSRRVYQFHPDALGVAQNDTFVVSWTGGLEQHAFDVKGRKSGVRAAPQIDVDPALDGLSSPPSGDWGTASSSPGRRSYRGPPGEPHGSGRAAFRRGAALHGTGRRRITRSTMARRIYQTRSRAARARAVSTTTTATRSRCRRPRSRPVQHWDGLLQETLSESACPRPGFSTICGVSGDVADGQPVSTPSSRRCSITAYRRRAAAYCPANPVTRAQMAVFLLKAKFGRARIPPPVYRDSFSRRPLRGPPFCPWIEELAEREVVGGCGGALDGLNNAVTRQQMAVFLLKAFEGSTYVPPVCTVLFDDVTCRPGSQFGAWIEELAELKITGGCSVTTPFYCPTNQSNRGQMAVFIVKTFGLVLYGG